MNIHQKIVTIHPTTTNTTVQQSPNYIGIFDDSAGAKDCQ